LEIGVLFEISERFLWKRKEKKAVGVWIKGRRRIFRFFL